MKTTQKARKEQLLINQAVESCEWRGHKMGDFEPISPYVAVSCCKQCNMQVAINTRPLPNEIDIGGEAVAVNCCNEYINA